MLFVLAQNVKELQHCYKRAAVIVAAESGYPVTVYCWCEGLVAPIGNGLYGVDMCVKQQCGTRCVKVGAYAPDVVYMTVHIYLKRGTTMNEHLQPVGSLALFAAERRGADEQLQQLNSLLDMLLGYLHKYAFVMVTKLQNIFYIYDILCVNVPKGYPLRLISQIKIVSSHL